MWRAFDETGRLAYPDFVETVVTLMPMYWVRVLGGVLYLTGAVICCVNVFMTFKQRGADLDGQTYEAAPISPYSPPEGGTVTTLRRSLADRWFQR